jgi:hypothetical protein
MYRELGQRGTSHGAPAAPAEINTVGHAWLWPLLFLVAYAAALAWQQHLLTSGVVFVPIGDHAADDILIVEAKQFQLLHGVYSRFGFYHPGPLILQVAALGELALVDWLSWFSSYAAAQSFAVALLHGIALAVTLRLWLLVTGNGLVALLAVAIVPAIIAHAGSPGILVKYWLAHSVVAGATMVATCFAGLFLRGPNWLPLLALGGVIMVNGHVSFVSIAPALVIATVLVAIKTRRLPFAVLDRAAVLQYTAQHRRPIAISAAIIAMGLLPIVIHTIAHWPAELPRYLETASGLRVNQPIKVVRAVVSFVPLYGLWMLVFLPWIRPAQETARQADIRIVGVCLFWTALVVAFLFSLRGVDSLELRFLFLWLTPFIGMSAAAAFVYAWSVWAHRLMRAGVVLVVVTLIASPLVAITRLSAESDTRLILDAAEALAGRAPPGRQSVVVLDKTSKHWGSMWSETVGVIAILNRRNDRSVCIDPASWHLLFHARYRCPEKRHPDDLVLHVVPPADATGTVIAPLLNVVVVQLDKAAR